MLNEESRYQPSIELCKSRKKPDSPQQDTRLVLAEQHEIDELDG